MRSDSARFLEVTESEGQKVSPEQLARSCHRYHWAARQSEGRDVLEVACGAGQGLNILAGRAASVVGGDVSPEVLAVAKRNFPGIPLSEFGAEQLPFDDASFDVVVLFEAIYYVDLTAFFAEAKRVLRPGGRLLITTANKDLYDFTPSPFTRRYLGAGELHSELAEAGFLPEVAGYLDTGTVSVRQMVLRPIKAIASRLGLIPKTMHGKEFLKKVFFGSLVEMPGDLQDVEFRFDPPTPIEPTPDRRHKVIYCCATKA